MNELFTNKFLHAHPNLKPNSYSKKRHIEKITPQFTTHEFCTQLITHTLKNSLFYMFEAPQYIMYFGIFNALHALLTNTSSLNIQA